MKITISEIISIPNGAPATIASLLSATPGKVKRLTLQPIGGDVAIGMEGMVYATSVKLVANSVDNNDVGTEAGPKEIELDKIYVDGNAGGITMNVMAWD